MKREDLDFLDNAELSSKEKVDKVMALHGKSIAKKDEEISTLTDKNSQLTDKVNTYETKIKEFDENSKDNADWKAKYEELQTSIAEKDVQAQKDAEEKLLNNNILEVFGDKKFTSNYAKNGLMQDIKNELAKPENKGKGVQEIFNTLTKDQTDIFENPNKMEDMPSMGEGEVKKETKEIPTIW